MLYPRWKLLSTLRAPNWQFSRFIPLRMENGMYWSASRIHRREVTSRPSYGGGQMLLKRRSFRSETQLVMRITVTSPTRWQTYLFSPLLEHIAVVTDFKPL